MVCPLEALTAKLTALLPHLDERQRRLALGAEARALGHGGIRTVARATGVSETTVSRGAREIDNDPAPSSRTRRPGAGRKHLRDIDPVLVPALLALVEPDQRGDPESPLRWTTKSTRNLAVELTRQGHPVGPDTVAALLKAEGFCLQGTSRTTEGTSHVDRDAQFHYINNQVTEHLDADQPVVSVDTKKKEVLGDYAVAGREWHRTGQPVKVRAHDFPEKGAAKAVPYGIYDIGADTGWVGVGCDGDTAAFAVATLRRWWASEGSHRYPDAMRLLITADAGGSNGYRVRALKKHLADFAHESGLEVTVCHFPPGTSKWNRIEHRLFSAISTNWRGRPLTSHEVVVNTIAATTTRTGLRVRAELDTGSYPTGETVSEEVMEHLPLDPHAWHGKWNYRLRPEPPAPRPERPGPDPALGRFPPMDRAPSWLGHPTLTGLEPAAFGALHERYLEHVQAHPTAVLPGKRRAFGTGSRKLSCTDRLTAALVTLRWRTPRSVLAGLLGVSAATVSHTVREVTADLQALGHIVPQGPIPVRTARDLAALVHQPAP